MTKLTKSIIIVATIITLITLAIIVTLNYKKNPIVIKKDTLTIGIFPRRDIPKTINMFSPIAEHIEKVTGISTKIVTTKSFLSFWNNVKNRKYDIIHYNQVHYVISNDKYGYKVILKNREFGSDTLNSTIVVRKDSNINSLSQLKNKTIYFGGGKLAFMSHIGNRIALRNKNINDTDYTWRYSKTPFKSVIDVYNKKADAAGVGNIVLKTKYMKSKILVEEMKTIYVGPKIVHLPWAVIDNMSENLTRKIINAMTSLSNTEEGKKLLKNAKLNAFLPAADYEYEIVRKMYQDYVDNTK